MLRWISICGGLLIMMGHHARSEALFYYFRLEDQIPEKHLLRLIEEHISFEFVRQQLKDSYSETGRPSIDPELLLRILLIGYLYGITSERKQDCHLNGSYSFKEVKDAVHRVTTVHIDSGFDDKIFNRSGDLASVAILQTLDDNEMMSSTTLRQVLSIIRNAFACPPRCVKAPSDRQPRVTLLLLEHMHNSTAGSAQTEIDDTKKYVIAAAGKP